MSANTAIEWAHHTFNPWWGCEKVSPACAHCYADAFAHRLGMDIWGPGTPRRFFGDKHWAEPLKWSRLAGVRGVQERVFCASMADVLEDREDLVPHRARLCELIRATPHLDWMLLTKRPENAERLLPAAWFAGEWPSNCWFGITVENQAMAELRTPLALSVPAPVHFLSMEPLLGEVNVTPWLRRYTNHHISLDIEGALRNRSFDALCDDSGRTMTRGEAEAELRRLLAAGVKLVPSGGCDDFDDQTGCRGHRAPSVDLVIAGGESGPNARPSHPDWFRRLRDDCVDAGVAFHFKQWGEWIAIDAMSPEQLATLDLEALHDAGRVDIDVHPYMSQCRVGKKAAGRKLDGRTWDQMPTNTEEP